MKRTLNVLPTGLNLSAGDSDRVMSALEFLNSVVPCAKFTYLRQSGAGVEPKEFLYKIEAANGRVWKQVLTFDVSADPSMTFDVDDEWRLSEFSSHRELRNVTVSIVAKYPTLEKLTYDFE